jgi:hypothetical protein
VRLALLAPLAAALTAASAAQAQMYKCVDERGVTHYSDKPRPGCKGGPVNIKPSPRMSGEPEPRKEDLKREEREFQRRRIERGRAEEKEARAAEAQRRRCERLKADVHRYSVARRIYTGDGKGERTFMDDATREAKLAELKAQIERQCR